MATENKLCYPHSTQRARVTLLCEPLPVLGEAQTICFECFSQNRAPLNADVWGCVKSMGK
jgi:hypothetical protein